MNMLSNTSRRDATSGEFDQDRRRFLGAAAVGVLSAGAAAWLPGEASAATGNETVRPFHVEFSGERLADLRERLIMTQWPERETVADASQGVRLATMQQLARYWRTDYDWRKIEARLNALPQYLTEIDGLDIHFIHVRSKHDEALPMIVTHGWPGSIIEQLKIIDPLTNPTAHGGSVADAFHLVIPSISGLRLLSQTDGERLGSGPRRARVDRAHAAARIRAICGAGRRLGQRHHRANGVASAAAIAWYSHKYASNGARRYRQGVATRRLPARQPAGG